MNHRQHRIYRGLFRRYVAGILLRLCSQLFPLLLYDHFLTFSFRFFSIFRVLYIVLLLVLKNLYVIKFDCERGKEKHLVIRGTYSLFIISGPAALQYIQI